MGQSRMQIYGSIGSNFGANLHSGGNAHQLLNEGMLQRGGVLNLEITLS